MWSADLQLLCVAILAVGSHGSLNLGELAEAERPGEETRSGCRRNNITEQTFYRWRNQSGGMDVFDARKLKVQKSENAKLRMLVAQQLLTIDALEAFSRGE